MSPASASITSTTASTSASPATASAKAEIDPVSAAWLGLATLLSLSLYKLLDKFIFSRKEEQKEASSALSPPSKEEIERRAENDRLIRESYAMLSEIREQGIRAAEKRVEQIATIIATHKMSEAMFAIMTTKDAAGVPMVYYSRSNDANVAQIAKILDRATETLERVVRQLDRVEEKQIRVAEEQNRKLDAIQHTISRE